MLLLGRSEVKEEREGDLEPNRKLAVGRRGTESDFSFTSSIAGTEVRSYKYRQNLCK